MIYDWTHPHRLTRTEERINDIFTSDNVVSTPLFSNKATTFVAEGERDHCHQDVNVISCYAQILTTMVFGGIF